VFANVPGTTEHEKYSICSTRSPKAFIFYDITKPQIASEKIRQMQANHSIYEQMMTEPILLDGWNVDKFMSACDGIGDASLKARIRTMMNIEN
jgi:hypothetical protein